MNTTEDRLRAAARAVAVTVPDGSAPPLRLPAPQARQAHFRATGRRRSAWLAPLAAAAAVVAVIAMSVAITRGPLSGAPAGSEAGPGSTPPYYVALTAATGQAATGAAAVIRRTATGLPVARVGPPRPSDRFTMVTAASDDRTFVLGSQMTVKHTPAGRGSSGPAGGSQATFGRSLQVHPRPVTYTQFYLLRFDPSRQQARLNQLPVPAVSQPVSGLALSPDGKKLAVAVSPPGHMKITVSTLATGSSRTWTGRWSGRPSPATPGSLSWVRSGPGLAFDWEPECWIVHGSCAAGTRSVRLLNTARPGTSLLGNSSPIPRGFGKTILSPLVTQFTLLGNDLYAEWGISWYPATEQWVTAALAAQGGKTRPPTGGMTHGRVNHPLVTHPLWASSTGSVLIVRLPGPQIDVVRGGRSVKLPATMPANPLGIAW